MYLRSSLLRVTKSPQSKVSFLAKRFSSCISNVEKRSVPLVSYDELRSGKDLTKHIEEAYGADGMGILAVSAVPELETLRESLLPLAAKFAAYPEEIKKKYELEDAYYSFGWSHGKEKLQGKPDFSKGSFYNNPQYNDPVNGDKELIEKFPAFVHPNIWPKEMPEMEPAFMNLGQRIVDVGILVAKQCDEYVASQVSTYTKGKLENIISTSRVCKARLLHYFALSANDVEQQKRAIESGKDLEMTFSDWCGWHNDHGSLTGLVQAMYTDENGNSIENPDPSAGLYVKNRQGEIIKAVIPEGHLVYQIGEAAQVHTGGVLQATPHAVRGPCVTGVNRETLAVFMEPEWHDLMAVPEGMDPQNAGRTDNLPHGVPPLSTRWDNSMDFNAFSEATLKAYH